ncbi:hypothetical protein I316_01900 [Kwoniella heveanensis BCC8398]|uniref:Zn(2)-C6 fungal-type domain-containing protein n=1 Tax=Kwoniella heveanensis BCC8398 TaxID=1296120 RepID=A0A1B9H075_9TREE|nr:hypothetical protein I316_01900 [Kwoniella heveanensis BCC8398]
MSSNHQTYNYSNTSFAQPPFTPGPSQTILYSSLPPPPAQISPSFSDNNSNGFNNGPVFACFPTINANGQIVMVPYMTPVRATPQAPVLCASPELIFGQRTVTEYRLNTPPDRSLGQFRDNTTVPSTRCSSPSPSPGDRAVAQKDMPVAVPMAMTRSRSQNQPPCELTSTAPLIRPAPAHLPSSDTEMEQGMSRTPSKGAAGSNDDHHFLPTPDNTPPRWTKSGKRLEDPTSSKLSTAGAGKGKLKKTSVDADIDEIGAQPQAKKRKRIQQACDNCRHRKARCSGETPSCQRCIDHGLTDCVYTKIPRSHPDADDFSKLPSGSGARKAKRPTDRHHRSAPVVFSPCFSELDFGLDHHVPTRQRMPAASASNTVGGSSIEQPPKRNRKRYHTHPEPATHVSESVIQAPFPANDFGPAELGLGLGITVPVPASIHDPMAINNDAFPNINGLQLDLGTPGEHYPLPIPMSTITLPEQTSSPIDDLMIDESALISMAD